MSFKDLKKETIPQNLSSLIENYKKSYEGKNEEGCKKDFYLIIEESIAQNKDWFCENMHHCIGEIEELKKIFKKEENIRSLLKLNNMLKTNFSHWFIYKSQQDSIKTREHYSIELRSISNVIMKISHEILSHIRNGSLSLCAIAVDAFCYLTKQLYLATDKLNKVAQDTLIPRIESNNKFAMLDCQIDCTSRFFQTPVGGFKNPVDALYYRGVENANVCFKTCQEIPTQLVNQSNNIGANSFLNSLVNKIPDMVFAGAAIISAVAFCYCVHKYYQSKQEIDNQHILFKDKMETLKNNPDLSTDDTIREHLFGSIIAHLEEVDIENLSSNLGFTK